MATIALERPTTPSPERLEEVWESKPGWRGILGTVDHKEIGKRYIVTAFVFFLLAGIEAIVFRTQLAVPNNTLLSPETYDQLFTMHGTTMIFFFSTPILFGFGNFLVPLMIGARDMAFPRLNAFGYWVFLFAGVFTYLSFIGGVAPDGGWFNYPPLTGPTYSPGPNIDFWCLGLAFLGMSTTVGSINFIVTIFKMRAPGMSINRMPLFTWNILATAFSVLFAVPSLTTGAVLLELERRAGFHFFDPAFGGQPLLYQHLFWIFGHPDVYIIFLPAVGMVSEIVPALSRRPIVGYSFVSMATVATAIIAFGVWVHHMFAVGIPEMTLSLFGISSLFVVVPSGVQMFAWVSTMWTGKPVLRTPLLFCAGFVVTFMIGGLTGPMFAVVPFDWAITDSYFVVAHFHYVLFGGAVFPIFAGMYYWLPKMTGRMLSEKLGVLNFWLMFIGFNLTFFPMHINGLLGEPRRIYTYQAGLGWSGLSFVETIGAYILGVSVLVFMINFFISQRRGAPAGPSPWGASTLEWATESPPHPYNFRVLPTVRGRDPLWEQETLFLPANSVDGGRVTLSTSTLDGEPDAILPMPEDSGWPLIAAIGLAVITGGAFFGQIVIMLIGIVISVVSAVGWNWPHRPVNAYPHSEERPKRRLELPIEISGLRATGWWGIAMLILTDGAIFGCLLASYFYLQSQSYAWPPDGIKKPDLALIGINTILLVASSLPMQWAEDQAKEGHRFRLAIGLLLAFVMGSLFLILQGSEYAHEDFNPQMDAYGSIFYAIVSFHALHVFSALVMNGFLQVRAWLGHFSRERYQAVQNVVLFWHFVDIIWVIVFFCVYLSVWVL